MLGGNKCVLSGNSEVQLATMSDCSLDPGVISSLTARRRSFFGSGAAEQESNLGRYGWLEGDRVCLSDFVSLSAPTKQSEFKFSYPGRPTPVSSRRRTWS